MVTSSKPYKGIPPTIRDTTGHEMKTRRDEVMKEIYRMTMLSRYAISISRYLESDIRILGSYIGSSGYPVLTCNTPCDHVHMV